VYLLVVIALRLSVPLNHQQVCVFVCVYVCMYVYVCIYEHTYTHTHTW